MYGKGFLENLQADYVQVLCGLLPCIVFRFYWETRNKACAEDA